MDEEEGGGIRLSKRFSDKGGEVDYRTKAGTAWSHSYLNQKPWHPLSYPNQRRKWIAEQTHAHRERRADEVAREVLLFSSVCLISSKNFAFFDVCFVFNCRKWKSQLHRRASFAGFCKIFKLFNYNFFSHVADC